MFTIPFPAAVFVLTREDLSGIDSPVPDSHLVLRVGWFNLTSQCYPLHFVVHLFYIKIN